MIDELKICPWCGGGTTQLHVNKGTWTGQGYGEPISVEVRHWCEEVKGQPSRMISRIGRDHTSAIAAWNTRAPAMMAGVSSDEGEQDGLGRVAESHPVDLSDGRLAESGNAALLQTRDVTTSCDGGCSKAAPAMSDEQIAELWSQAQDQGVSGIAPSVWFARALLAGADVKESLTVDGKPKSTERATLESVSQDLEISSWQCPQCGHAEDTKDMDVASTLREYLSRGE